VFGFGALIFVDLCDRFGDVQLLHAHTNVSAITCQHLWVMLAPGVHLFSVRMNDLQIILPFVCLPNLYFKTKSQMDV
jgi:hypothetical protein